MNILKRVGQSNVVPVSIPNTLRNTGDGLLRARFGRCFKAHKRHGQTAPRRQAPAPATVVKKKK